MVVELGICIISMRGSILDTAPRAQMHYWLYAKLGKFHFNSSKHMQCMCVPQPIAGSKEREEKLIRTHFTESELSMSWIFIGIALFVFIHNTHSKSVVVFR